MDKGRLFHSSFFSAKLLKIEGLSRFSVAVSKKVAKKAVDRNKTRRRVYSSLRPIIAKISGIHGVIMIKAPVLKASLKEIESEMAEFFVKIGLLK